MTVFIFGNPDVDMDALPFRILPELKKRFPEITFETKDPNEEWEIPKELIVIDTALGIDQVTIFDDLEPFARSTNLSMHDFDALTNLRFLQKLGKLQEIKIIGLPPTISESNAIQEVSTILSNLPSGSASHN